MIRAIKVWWARLKETNARARHNAYIDFQIRELKYERGIMSENIATTNSMPDGNKAAAFADYEARRLEKIKKLKESRL